MQNLVNAIDGKITSMNELRSRLRNFPHDLPSQILGEALDDWDSDNPSGGETGVAARVRDHGLLDALPLEIQTALFPNTDLYQTHRIVKVAEQDRIFTTTSLRLPNVDPGKLADFLFSEPWDWWRGGSIRAFSKDGDRTRFILGPIGIKLLPASWMTPSRVGLELQKPVRRQQSQGVFHPCGDSDAGAKAPTFVIDAKVSAHFSGDAAYEVVTVEGGAVFRSLWKGVAATGGLLTKRLPINLVLAVHMAAESGTGTWFPPLKAGTGFRNLLRVAEGI